MVFYKVKKNTRENPMNTKTTVISQEALENQFAFCDKIAALWAAQGVTPKAYVETSGSSATWGP